MHANNKQWVSDLKKRYPKSFTNAKVLELGSGSKGELTVRNFFENCTFVGVDRVGKEGGNNGVDIVSEAIHTSFKKDTFDTLVCLSMFEHDPDWKESFIHNLQWVKPGGMIFTCFGAEGNNHHGPEPWKLVPYKEFLALCNNLPITLIDAFFEEVRYGMSDTPGVFDVVARKHNKYEKGLPKKHVTISLPEKTTTSTFSEKITYLIRVGKATSLSTIIFGVLVFLLWTLAIYAAWFYHLFSRFPLGATIVSSICFILGIVGYFGHRTSPQINIPQMWDHTISNVERFFIPFVLSMLLGIVGVFIINSSIYSSNFEILSTSIISAISIGIIFQFCFITLLTWLISTHILHIRGNNYIFWIVTVLSSLIFALIISVNFSTFLLSPFSTANKDGIFLYSVVTFFLASFLYKKFGFLSCISIYFWTILFIQLF